MIAQAIAAQFRWQSLPMLQTPVYRDPYSPRGGRPRAHTLTDAECIQLMMYYAYSQILGNGINWRMISDHLSVEKNNLRLICMRAVHAMQTRGEGQQRAKRLGVLTMAQRDDIAKIWILRHAMSGRMGVNWPEIQQTILSTTGASASAPFRIAQFIREHAKARGYSVEAVKR